jgi:hypothetical protein
MTGRSIESSPEAADMVVRDAIREMVDNSRDLK